MALGGRLLPGFDLVADEIDLHDHIVAADLVITGEGYLDEQSFEGKVIGGVQTMCAAVGCPVAAVVGDSAPEVHDRIRHRSLHATTGSSPRCTSRCGASSRPRRRSFNTREGNTREGNTREGNTRRQHRKATRNGNNRDGQGVFARLRAMATADASVPSRADLAIVNCTALVGTSAGRAHFAPDTTITITDGRFSAIDTHPDGNPVATDVIDARGMVAMPGLINTHSHAAMTLFRGAAEDVSVTSRFNDYIWPMEVNVGERDVYLGTLLAAAEMIECGVTTSPITTSSWTRRPTPSSTVACAPTSAPRSSVRRAEGLEQSIDFTRWQGGAGGRITTSIALTLPTP